MNRSPRVVVVGSLVFDFVATCRCLPQKGETVLGEKFGMFPGGKGANQAVQAGRLGAQVFMLGCVGDDFLANALLTSLQQSGVDTRYVRRDKAQNTGACCIHVDARGDNTIVIAPEANNACCEADIDSAADVIRAADVLICQLEIPLRTVEYACRFASRNGIRTILNPAPAQPLPAMLLSAVGILTPNEIEAEHLTGLSRSQQREGTESWETAAVRILRVDGAKEVILTLGDRGAFVTDANRESLVPAYPVEVVDATAAGDAFNGALAVALAEGKDLFEAAAFANGAGALAATKAGAQPSLATRTELEEFLHLNRASH